MKKVVISGLGIALLYSLYWNYQQSQALGQLGQKLTNSTAQNTTASQRVNQLENQIHALNRQISQARKDFWKLRLLVNEWTILKGTKEIKELVKKMRNNPVLEEVIK